MSKIKIKLTSGDMSRDFQVGNLLNAIDVVAKWFLVVGNIDSDFIAQALRLYADQLERDN